MKKALAVLLAVLMLGITALADTSYDLLTRWEQDGYPEDVTGIFYNTETETLSILLTQNTEARRTAITNTVTDGATLLFFEGAYSHAQLTEVQNAIAAEQPEGLQKVTVGWGAVGGFGTSGKDFRVVVQAADEMAQQLAERYAEEYGDLVVVQTVSEWRAAEEAARQAADAENTAKAGGLSDWGIIGIFAALLVIAIVVIEVLSAKRKKKKAEGGPLHL